MVQVSHKILCKQNIPKYNYTNVFKTIYVAKNDSTQLKNFQVTVNLMKNNYDIKIKLK